MTATSAAVTATTVDAVRVVTLDDGKANALNHEVIDALRAELRTAEADSGAMVLAGRPNRFSAGFDLSIMTSGPDQAMPLIKAGADLAMDIYLSRVPVVVACTGHAVGMNEVGIGMPVPHFAMTVARDRLSSRWFVQAIQHARLFDPELAIDAGYLDEVAPADTVVDVAVTHAQRLATDLRPTAFRMTRDIMRAPVAEAMRAGLATDMSAANFG